MKEFATNCPNYHHNVGGGTLSWAVVRQNENGQIYARRRINKWESGWKEVSENDLQPYEKEALKHRVEKTHAPADF